MHMVMIQTWGDAGVSTNRTGMTSSQGNNGIQDDKGYQNNTKGQRATAKPTNGWFDKGK